LKDELKYNNYETYTPYYINGTAVSAHR